MAPPRWHHDRRRMAIFVRVGLYTLLFLMGYVVPLIIFYNRSRADTFEDTPRSGEAFISDENFFHCIAERLSYKEQHPARIPYVLIPVTMDYQDIKQLFCNITVPMTYIMFINNGMFRPLRSLLDRLAVDLRDYVDQNLFIIHHPENIGYASAVNEGLRHALNFSVAKVPWVFITNADVRFAPGLIDEFVSQANEKTQGQLERIRRLDQEIIAEARTLRNVPNRRFAFRSSQHPIITASSLPYRIRTMPPEEMKKQFADTYGIFYTDHKDFMATFALSRLAIATVGFFDENYYPAYGEDHDYVWRMAALGYQKYFSEPGKFVHFENANLNVGGSARNRGIFKNTAYFLQSVKFGRMNYQPFRLQYRRAKWFPDGVTIYQDTGRNPLPFNGTIPLDMWVLDTDRRRSIWEIGENIRCHRDYKPYSMKLLDFPVDPS
ncbi:beta galactofuranosyl transferase / LPG1 [Leishmania donovani]|uniref:Beta_galactofuranosyl_transferase/GeneDB:LmjF.25. 0010 n=1 Tax=Leishmania donovani TaxID=5661 RepID=A0A504XV56_LEIDO|nr:Glycosyl transferase 2 family protein [Leishmania donovani]CAJ1989321.1 beta galactofuranosyl transferase / LPG1 [Leishmania donovani]VDZ45188.1 beta_galactofuranosyl_transferase/GeneDB:LmjF.25.0010 [Leishmania donovani]